MTLAFWLCPENGFIERESQNLLASRTLLELVCHRWPRGSSWQRLSLWRWVNACSAGAALPLSARMHLLKFPQGAPSSPAGTAQVTQQCLRQPAAQGALGLSPLAVPVTQVTQVTQPNCLLPPSDSDWGGTRFLTRSRTLLLLWNLTSRLLSPLPHILAKEMWLTPDFPQPALSRQDRTWLDVGINVSLGVGASANSRWAVLSSGKRLLHGR